ncbi:MAG: hypothetical protein E6230_02580 [Paenibacillus dendritiformis]|uniref:hypothetical protein n=1 Tax=uncultured Paenibacillus sp. TaxID=227322 RepID=UPI0025F8DFCF|nr:hypothetical protein [uncultured Paenibacillus sp.]MDU5141059.1 hypothetical protein [Paenibacillus dendritiformis]
MKKPVISVAAGLIAGIIIGAAAMVSTPAFGAAKQYVLTLFERPVIVNGIAYKDAENPILNYEGKAYIPLAKIGDLTGVQYKWNSEKKQVEINSGNKGGGTSGPAGLENVNLKPNSVIIVDAEPFKGYNEVPDSADLNIEFAEIEGQPQPPLLSEGWVSEDLLDRVLGYSTLLGDEPNTVKIDKNYEVLLTLNFPEGWSEKGYGETIVSGIQVKRHMKTNYYNIVDLEKAIGAIK